MIDRRVFLTGTSAAALSIALPGAAPAGPGYLQRLILEHGRAGMIPAVPSAEQMDAWFARWERLTALYANSRVMDIAHLPGTGILNEPVRVPAALNRGLI